MKKSATRPIVNKLYITVRHCIRRVNIRQVQKNDSYATIGVA